ncbi:hypothetical protein M422DRAFT_255700 [Sphaerobolus stellatus SS14]|uniref:Uncharacterized protein n=1 Tax=Sphaerobolus stellatus (strain SS14) TaxID=990650 RepID=A0A0C9VSZ3_SPHS4|nr:hypothetical protein M422DRAFT_255700 [Sphaerobolus stellatus SS14]
MANTQGQYTEQELRDVWKLERPEDARLIAPALRKLYDPATSQRYHEVWIHVLFDATKAAAAASTGLRVNAPNLSAGVIPRGGYNAFYDKCLDNGLLEALMRHSDLHSPKTRRTRALAMQMWDNSIMLSGTLAKVGQAHRDLVHLCKDVLVRSFQSELAAQRLQTPKYIKSWCGGPWIQDLDPEEIAELSMACLDYAHNGEESIIKDLRAGELYENVAEVATYLGMFINSHSKPAPQQISDELPLVWSLSRDQALYAVMDLLNRRKVWHQRRDCLKLVENHDTLFEQLLIIISHFERPWYHPFANADATALKLLVFLLKTPHVWLGELSDRYFNSPNAPIPPEGITQSIKSEWQAHVELMRLFVQERTWKTALLRKWDRLERDGLEHIISKLRDRQRDTPLVFPSIGSLLNDIYSERGISRIAILRILTNLTYGPNLNEPLVPTNTLFSLLSLAYSASQKIPSKDKAQLSHRHAEGTVGRKDYYLRMERTSVIESSYHPRQPIPGAIVSFWVQSESITGPTLLVRLLRRIYQTYPDIANWMSMPPNTVSNDQLGRIQQITSPEVVRIVVNNIVTKRIPGEKAELAMILRNGSTGRRLSEGSPEDVCRGGYLAVAELALDVTRLYNESPESVRSTWSSLVIPAQKEAIACIGNVSVMASHISDWDTAWWFAKCALDELEGVNEAAAKASDWNPEDMKKKNRERIEKAEEKLALVT